MNPSGDDLDEMYVTDPALADLLDELSTLVDEVTPPPPSDELEALFTSSLPLARRGRPARDRLPIARRLLTPLLAAAAIAALLVVGAATHHLPASAQRFVSNVVNTVTPFHIDPGEHPASPPVRSHRSQRSHRSHRSHRALPQRTHPVVPVRSHGPVSAPVRSTPGLPLPGRTAVGGTAVGGAPGHGKAHGGANGAAPGRGTAPGRLGRVGGHGGGRPASSSPVPSVSISTGAHGIGKGVGKGTANGGNSSGNADRTGHNGPRGGAPDAGLGQYTKLVRNALPKHWSGSSRSASARNSSSRG